MANKRKIEYLSYLEDTKKHHGVIEKVAREAVKKAIANAKEKSVDITYLKGEKIVKESPDGTITEIAQLPNNSRIVKVGTKAKIF
jgi:hypothetical protein